MSRKATNLKNYFFGRIPTRKKCCKNACESICSCLGKSVTYTVYDVCGILSGLKAAISVWTTNNVGQTAFGNAATRRFGATTFGIQHKRKKELAEQLGVTQQTVSKHLREMGKDTKRRKMNSAWSHWSQQGSTSCTVSFSSLRNEYCGKSFSRGKLLRAMRSGYPLWRDPWRKKSWIPLARPIARKAESLRKESFCSAFSGTYQGRDLSDELLEPNETITANRYHRSIPFESRIGTKNVLAKGNVPWNCCTM